MSVVEADEQDRGTILHYAPRHVRLPADDRSIRPILERLSRGENEGPAGAKPEPARLETTTIPLELPRPRIGRQLLACSVLSAGLSAGLAVLAIAWLAPGKTEIARLDHSQLDPKLVRTVSFKPETQAAALNESDLQKPAPEAAPPIQPKEPAPPAKTESRNDQIAPKELLALWSGIPTDVPSVPASETAPSAATDGAEPAGSEAEPPRETPARSTAHRHRVPPHHRTHSARVRTIRPQQQDQSAAAAAQSAAPATLQSSLQSLFSRSAADSQQAKQSY